MKSYPETIVAESDSANIFKIGLLVLRYYIINIFECHIFFNFNQIVMAFDVVNDKTFPKYEVEKIVQIGQTVQKL